MDAKMLGREIIKEAINEGSYELTGILETGEIIISIVNPTSERKIIEKYLDNKNISNEKKLKIIERFMKTKGRSAQELMQVYKQKCSLDYPRCKKNNLIIRRI